MAPPFYTNWLAPATDSIMYSLYFSKPDFLQTFGVWLDATKSTHQMLQAKAMGTASIEQFDRFLPPGTSFRTSPFVPRRMRPPLDVPGPSAPDDPVQTGLLENEADSSEAQAELERERRERQAAEAERQAEYRRAFEAYTGEESTGDAERDRAILSAREAELGEQREAVATSRSEFIESVLPSGFGSEQEVARALEQQQQAVNRRREFYQRLRDDPDADPNDRIRADENLRLARRWLAVDRAKADIFRSAQALQAAWDRNAGQQEQEQLLEQLNAARQRVSSGFSALRVLAREKMRSNLYEAAQSRSAGDGQGQGVAIIGQEEDIEAPVQPLEAPPSLSGIIEDSRYAHGGVSAETGSADASGLLESTTTGQGETAAGTISYADQYRIVTGEDPTGDFAADNANFARTLTEQGYVPTTTAEGGTVWTKTDSATAFTPEFVDTYREVTGEDPTGDVEADTANYARILTERGYTETVNEEGETVWTPPPPAETAVASTPPSGEGVGSSVLASERRDAHIQGIHAQIERLASGEDDLGSLPPQERTRFETYMAFYRYTGELPTFDQETDQQAIDTASRVAGIVAEGTGEGDLLPETRVVAPPGGVGLIDRAQGLTSERFREITGRDPTGDPERDQVLIDHANQLAEGGAYGDLVVASTTVANEQAEAAARDSIYPSYQVVEIPTADTGADPASVDATGGGLPVGASGSESSAVAVARGQSIPWATPTSAGQSEPLPQTIGEWKARGTVFINNEPVSVQGLIDEAQDSLYANVAETDPDYPRTVAKSEEAVKAYLDQGYLTGGVRLEEHVNPARTLTPAILEGGFNIGGIRYASFDDYAGPETVRPGPRQAQLQRHRDESRAANLQRLQAKYDAGRLQLGSETTVPYQPLPDYGYTVTELAGDVIAPVGLAQEIHQSLDVHSPGGQTQTGGERQSIGLEGSLVLLDAVPVPVGEAVGAAARGTRALVDAGGNVIDYTKGVFKPAVARAAEDLGDATRARGPLAYDDLEDGFTIGQNRYSQEDLFQYRRPQPGEYEDPARRAARHADERKVLDELQGYRDSGILRLTKDVEPDPGAMSLYELRGYDQPVSATREPQVIDRPPGDSGLDFDAGSRVEVPDTDTPSGLTATELLGSLEAQQAALRAQGRTGAVQFLDETSPPLATPQRGTVSPERLARAEERQALIDAQRYERGVAEVPMVTRESGLEVPASSQPVPAPPVLRGDYGWPTAPQGEQVLRRDWTVQRNIEAERTSAARALEIQRDFHSPPQVQSTSSLSPARREEILRSVTGVPEPRAPLPELPAAERERILRSVTGLPEPRETLPPLSAAGQERALRAVTGIPEPDGVATAGRQGAPASAGQGVSAGASPSAGAGTVPMVELDSGLLVPASVAATPGRAVAEGLNQESATGPADSVSQGTGGAEAEYQRVDTEGSLPTQPERAQGVDGGRLPDVEGGRGPRVETVETPGTARISRRATVALPQLQPAHAFAVGPALGAEEGATTGAGTSTAIVTLPQPQTVGGFGVPQHIGDLRAGAQGIEGVGAQGAGDVEIQEIQGVGTQDIQGLDTQTIEGLETRTIEDLGTQTIEGLETRNIEDIRRVDDLGTPGPRDGTGEDPFLKSGRVIRPKPEEGSARRPVNRRRAEQPAPGSIQPVEGNRPLAEGEWPRHVTHEEVVLDVDRGDGSVDRVLVDVGEPRITTADPTAPPPGEHVAGNQLIRASGKTVTGESVNPVLPPRDAAERHPDGQVEEAVFVTDLDTGETTVYRYRDPREPGESLEQQLERTAEEERRVSPPAAESAPEGKYDRARRILAAAAREAGGTAVRTAGTVAERSRAIREGAERAAETHAPETRAALQEKARTILRGAERERQQAGPRPSLDSRLAQAIRGQAAQPAGQKKGGKSALKRSGRGLSDKDLLKPGGKRKVIIYYD